MVFLIIIDSIRSALDDLPLLEKVYRNQSRAGKNDLALLMILFRNRKLKYLLKNLVTFLLCARRNLSNDVELRFDDKDGTLGSLLQRIDDAIRRNARRIRGYCHGCPGESQIIDAESIIDNFECDIKRFEKEMGQWYVTLLDFLQRPSSPGIDEITEIIDSVLENLVDFVSLTWWHSVEPIEAMVEKVKFLRNFIRFATLPSVDPPKLEELLAHVGAVAVNAAHISYMIQYFFNEEWRKEMPSNISVLLQKIKLIDPQVYEIYAQALTSSKLSTQLHSPVLDMDHDPLVIMKDFIDFLLWNLWKMLRVGTRLVISAKDQLQLLYEGLRFLRTILKEQPEKFNEKTMDLARVVICDAGVIIFSLYQKDAEIAVSISDLLEKIKRIRMTVEGKDPETFKFPRTNELGFIDFLLENLKELINYKAEPSVQSQFQTFHERLVGLRSFLVTIVEVRNEQKELQDIWNFVLEVAYSVEDLMDQFVLGDFRGSFSTSFDSIAEDIIRKIETVDLKIGRRQDIKVEKGSKTSNLLPSKSSAPVADEIVGLDDDITSIINRLTRGSKQLKIVAIVGMPGIGKTTLATKVYDDPSVMYGFHVRLWCSVSQLFDKKKVLLELLSHTDPYRNSEMHEQDLAERLWRHLKGKRYLIFLDDVWDIEAWNCLEGTFPDDSLGSRVILTSRHHDVAPPCKLDEEPHIVRQLTNNKCLELLQRKVCPGTCWPQALHELGKQIAENCKGLPLTVVIVAGLLANLKLEGWKKVLEYLSSGIISSTEQCMSTLELSYKYLPDYLKPCFLYFGLFPEDRKVSVKRLIWLWIAEGFVHKSEAKSLEDVARDYLMDLVGRSLVIVSKKRSRGGVKACRIHDLLHDFCRNKANEENFFQLLKGYDELLSFKEPGYPRRLCVHSEMKYLKNLRLFCPHVHSLLFFCHNERFSRRRYDISFVIPIYKHLRVLDIRQFFLNFGFPSEMGLLVLLKYLSVFGDIDKIPSSIGSLSNLVTFIVKSAKRVALPDTFWHLHKLRHLDIRNGFHFPIENFENSSDLYELESCSGAIIFSWDSIKKQMKKFPNIRKLRCHLFQHWDTVNPNKILIPDFLSRLESLHVSEGLHIPQPLGCKVPDHVWFKFGFPENLRKLTLERFRRLSCREISRIGKLPNLEVLKLRKVDFPGKTWDMVEGEFSKLRFLKLADSKIVRWTASDDQFLCLEKLVLQSCYYLKEIPCCLENILTLEMIDVSNCTSSVASLVKRIQEVQVDMGNFGLKIHSSCN